jgi:hypothetical protein
MHYCPWFPFCVAAIGFVAAALSRDISADQKRHMMAISFGFAAFAAAVAQPIHDPLLYLVQGIIAGGGCYRLVWEASQWQKS